MPHVIVGSGTIDYPNPEFPLQKRALALLRVFTETPETLAVE